MALVELLGPLPYAGEMVDLDELTPTGVALARHLALYGPAAGAPVRIVAPGTRRDMLLDKGVAPQRIEELQAAFGDLDEPELVLWTGWTKTMDAWVVSCCRSTSQTRRPGRPPSNGSSTKPRRSPKVGKSSKAARGSTASKCCGCSKPSTGARSPSTPGTPMSPEAKHPHPSNTSAAHPCGTPTTSTPGLHEASDLAPPRTPHRGTRLVKVWPGDGKLRPVDTRWAISQLQYFIDSTELRQPESAYSSAGADEIEAEAQVALQILSRVLPGWERNLQGDYKKPWAKERAAAIRAQTQLMRQEELDEKLGDKSPVVRVAEMHPWVWSAARSLWESGHYGEAVRAVSVKVNAELQRKTGRRDIAEQALFQESFSADPPHRGRPRLRLPNDDLGKTSTAVRRGVIAFAEGCYAALRNPLTHEVGAELSEQEAVEQLAAFSLLARWVDSAELMTA